jgi:hypothetical protein
MPVMYGPKWGYPSLFAVVVGAGAHRALPYVTRGVLRSSMR